MVQNLQSKRVKVSAQAYWVNSGIYLRAGETVHISAKGSWYVSPQVSFIDAGTTPLSSLGFISTFMSFWNACVERIHEYSYGRMHGPEGRSGFLHEHLPSQVGALEARIGLNAGEFSNNQSGIHIGRQKTITASEDGFLYFSAVGPSHIRAPSHDRENNAGEVTVTVTTQNADQELTILDPITTEDIPTTQFMDLHDTGIETLEVEGSHIIFSVPTAWFVPDAFTNFRTSAPFASLSSDELVLIMNFFDQIYEYQYELIGTQPYGGQKIRIIMDDSGNSEGLAGNPIFMEGDLWAAAGSHSTFFENFLEGYRSLFSHELGHTFEFIFQNFLGPFDEKGTFHEIWTNLIRNYALEKLCHSEHPDHVASQSNCYYLPSQQEVDDYLAHGNYEQLSEPYSKTGLAMLMEIKDQHGWDAYKKFFRYMKDNPLPDDMTTSERWSHIRDYFKESANVDIGSILDKWHVPHRFMEEEPVESTKAVEPPLSPIEEENGFETDQDEEWISPPAQYQPADYMI